MRMSKKLIGIFLVLCMVLSIAAVGIVSTSAEGTITVYAKSYNSWDSNVYVYYWGEGVTSPEWPGVKMDFYCNPEIYTKDIPDGVTGIIFSNGSGDQTTNINSGIADGAFWRIQTSTTWNDNMNKRNWSLEQSYYLVGTMNSWGFDDAYKFVLSTENDSDYAIEYKLTVDLDENDEFKVKSSGGTWYPSDGSNYGIGSDGTYTIYFHPDAPNDTDFSDWYYYCFYVANVTPYTITWVDYNDTVLETDENVIYGTLPSYDSANPTREGYLFTGWTPEVEGACMDQTYKATYVPRFDGHTLSLDGDISVNFYANLTADEYATMSPSVVFNWTVDVDGTDKAKSYTATDLDYVAGRGYRATCPISPAEMTSKITATLKFGDDVVATSAPYSAKQYADTILTSSAFETAYTAAEGAPKYYALKELVSAMLKYGAAAQDQFGVNLDDYAADVTDIDSVDVATVRALAYQNDMTYNLPSGITYTGATLLCRNTTALRLFYVTEPAAYEAIKDELAAGSYRLYENKSGEDVTNFCVELSNIAPAQYHSESLNVKFGSYDRLYNVYDYLYRALASVDTTEETKTLASALFFYGSAAEEFFYM